MIGFILAAIVTSIEAKLRKLSRSIKRFFGSKQTDKDRSSFSSNDVRDWDY